MRVSARMLGSSAVGALTLFVFAAQADAATNLVKNGSFEGVDGLTDWSIGGTASDNVPPVAIAYNQSSAYPTGAVFESVPTDNAVSASPDAAGDKATYFVSDEAKNLSVYQYVYLTPGAYQIGFDSYDTYNGAMQPHDATLTAEIAGVGLANFDLASVSPGTWTNHAGDADILNAGDYLVSFAFNTPDTPADPVTNPNGIYNAKDVLIDRVYVVSDPLGVGTPISSAPEPSPWALMIAGVGGIGLALRRARAVLTFRRGEAFSG